MVFGARNTMGMSQFRDFRLHTGFRNLETINKPHTIHKVA